MLLASYQCQAPYSSIIPILRTSLLRFATDLVLSIKEGVLIPVTETTMTSRLRHKPANSMHVFGFIAFLSVRFDFCVHIWKIHRIDKLRNESDGLFNISDFVALPFTVVKGNYFLKPQLFKKGLPVPCCTYGVPVDDIKLTIYGKCPLQRMSDNHPAPSCIYRLISCTDCCDTRYIHGKLRISPLPDSTIRDVLLSNFVF